MQNRIIKLFNSSPKVHDCEFLEQGLVNYKDLGAGFCLLKKETIDGMLNSMIGIPVIIGHQKVTAENVKKIQNGVVIGTYFNSQTGKYHAKFIVTNEVAQDKIDREGYSVSCAYDTTGMGPGGKWHAIPYNQEILGGKFTHLALVPSESARYEESFIDTGIKVFQNSLGEARLIKDKPQQEGKKMLKFKFTWPKLEIENSKDKLDANKTVVEIGGKSVGLNKLIEAYNSKTAGVTESEEITEDSTIEILNSKGETVQVAIKDLVEAYNASDEDDEKKKKDEENEKKELENSMDEEEKKKYDAMDDKGKCEYRNSKKEMKNAAEKEEKEKKDKLAAENAVKVANEKEAKEAAQRNMKNFVVINSKGKGEVVEHNLATKNDGTRASGLKVAQGYFGNGKFSVKK